MSIINYLYHSNNYLEVYCYPRLSLVCNVFFKEVSLEFELGHLFNEDTSHLPSYIEMCIKLLMK